MSNLKWTFSPKMLKSFQKLPLKLFLPKEKKKLKKLSWEYLALFDIVYHLNGQQTVEINGDEAKGISYCFVTLIGKGMKNQSGVSYNDTYVK